ncbi:hypothetical protein BC936DRAFT_139563 [Jimgerdemannia flammicorona]|uniref:Telomerase reverse transcriptase n=1 Tax=Jimgerdemannia flammicorona TaxID=994334 RepID=A0A433DHN2_9FUNG|nr:hypothetical protein BC936DRAFT_139563 [Jimgerdemannia flammicorona]
MTRNTRAHPTPSLTTMNEPIAHPVLSLYFPEGWTSLYEYLVKNSGDAYFRDFHLTFNKFLATTIVARPSAEFPRGSNRNEDWGLSQDKVVGGAIESLLAKASRAGQKSEHLLTRGYRIGGDAVSGMFTNVTMTHINTLMNVVRFYPWDELLERIGNRAMQHLLKDMFIFIALDNGSYCQLTGTYSFK